MTVMSGPDSKSPQPPGCPPENGAGFARLLQGQLGCGVLIVDAARQVIGLTPRARELLGLAQAATKPPALTDLPAAVQEVLAEAGAARQAPVEGVLELKTGATGTRTIRFSAQPLSPGKADASIALLLHDLSAARQIEERLEQLDRLANIGTLAAAMAHEIRNALVAGKTFVDLLLEKNQDAELAGLVQREMGRIDGIVGRMLKFGGSARVEFSAVRLHEVLEHSLRLVQPKLDDKQVSLTRSFRAGVDMVKGDERQLQQAFVNLLLNALDAMGQNGSLAVGTETVPPASAAGPAQLRVILKDDGPGIPPELIGQLFEPFFTTKPNGTGLGLAITRRIVLDHHGDIRVESQPGQGAAFHILLPAAA